MVELSELDGMKKSDVESVKRFITTLTDRYRPANGRHVVSIPRSFVFAGSMNETISAGQYWKSKVLARQVCRHRSGAKEVLSRILESTTFKKLHLTCSRAYHRLATLMYDFASSTAMN